MKRIIKLGILVLLLLPLLSSCATKTVVVKCPASGATITVDGEYAGHQQATFRVKYIGWKSVTVSAPQYLTETFTMRGGGGKYREVCLQRDATDDDAMEASVPASDIANKNIRFRATSEKSDDEIWYSLIRYASDYFGDFTVNDKGAGWAKSTWVTRTFNRIKVRSRLEIKRNPGDKKEFSIYLASEYTTRKGCSDDECYQQWDRVLKSYVELPSALKTAVQ